MNTLLCTSIPYILNRSCISVRPQLYLRRTLTDQVTNFGNIKENFKFQNIFTKWKNVMLKERSGNTKNTFMKLTFKTKPLISCSAVPLVLSATSSKEHDRLEGTDALLQIQEKEPPFDWGLFWELLKPQLHYFIAAILSALVVSLTNVQIPSLLAEVINVVARFGRQNDTTNSADFAKQVFEPAVKIVKAYIVQSGFTFVYISFLTRMGERLAVDLRQRLFQAYLKQDIAFYDKHKSGELLNRLTSDVQDFKSSFKMCISQGMRSVTQIIGCGFSMYAVSPWMAASAAVVVPCVIGVGAALGSVLRAVSRAAQQQVGLSTAVADECVSNIRTVRSFAMEDREQKLFEREVDKSRQLNERLGIGIGIFQAGANLFMNSLVLGTLYIGGGMVSSGQVRPGDLMAFLVNAQTIQKSLGQLTIMWGTFIRGLSAGARVFDYVNTQATIPLKGGGRIPYHSLLGGIEFKNVTFSYPTRPDQEVLSDFSLKIPPSRVVAIVGASGGGKSTVAQLLQRFYDIDAGAIELDGRDLRSLDPSWLRGSVLGYVSQEPALFATTIRENIRYGKPDATDLQVSEAASLANLDGFISSLPLGLGTRVGERGASVSGGQKQRIAIARAIIKDPSVLVLDEATSALDAESERWVQAALEKCSQGRTTIVIAHRLSTIKNADIIAVVQNGNIVELGNHDTLKKQNGIYAALIRQQHKDENSASKKRNWGNL